MFRHPNDVLNYCVYIIPGNPKVVPEKLDYWHDWLMKKDPNISRALGDNFKIERMKAGTSILIIIKSENKKTFSGVHIEKILFIITIAFFENGS